VLGSENHLSTPFANISGEKMLYVATFFEISPLKIKTVPPPLQPIHIIYRSIVTSM
jgi:hypothetical protein